MRIKTSRFRRLGAAPSCGGLATRLAYMRARGAGLELGPLLRRAKLTRTLVEQDDARLSVLSQITFLSCVAEAIADDELGVHIAQSFDLRQIGLLHYVAASSEQLSSALQQIARFSVVANEGVTVRMTTGDDVHVRLRYGSIPRYLDKHQVEFWVVSVVRSLRQLAGRQIRPVRVRLVHRRGGGKTDLDRFLGRAVEYGADADEIVLSKETCALRVVGGDPHLNNLLLKYAEEALAHANTKSADLLTKVQNSIVPLLPHGNVRVASVAKRLGLSERTLARKLASVGLTYSEALEQLRRVLARRYLAEDDLSVSRVAWLLGFREVSAFTNAFRRWTGHTPTAERNRPQRLDKGRSVSPKVATQGGASKQSRSKGCASSTSAHSKISHSKI
jgi:AraC-like DNA-binding protein